MSNEIIFDTNNYALLKALFDTICVAYNEVSPEAMRALFKNEGIVNESGNAHEEIKYEHIVEYFKSANTPDAFDQLIIKLKEAAGNSKSFYINRKTKYYRDIIVFSLSTVEHELKKPAYHGNTNEDKSQFQESIREYFGIFDKAKSFSEIIDPYGPDLRYNKRAILLLNLAKNLNMNIKVIPPVFHEFVQRRSAQLLYNNNPKTANQPEFSVEARKIYDYAIKQSSYDTRISFLKSINAEQTDKYVGHIGPTQITDSQKATDDKKSEPYSPIHEFLKRVYNADPADVSFFYYKAYLKYIVDHIYDNLNSQSVSDNFQKLKNICSKYSHLHDYIDSYIMLALDAVKGKGGGGNSKGTKNSNNYYAALSKTWTEISHGIHDIQNANTMYNDKQQILEVIARVLYQRGQEFNFYDFMMNAYAKVHNVFLATANTKMIYQLHSGVFKNYFDDVKILFTSLDYSYSKETLSKERENSFRAVATELEGKFYEFLNEKTIIHLRSVFEDYGLAIFFSQPSLDTYTVQLNEYIETLKRYYHNYENHEINFNTKTWESSVTNWQLICDTLHTMSFLLKPSHQSHLKINAAAISNRARDLSKLKSDEKNSQEDIEKYKREFKRVLDILDNNAIGGINDNNVHIHSRFKGTSREILLNRQKQFAGILHKFRADNSDQIERLSLDLNNAINPGVVGTSSGLCLTNSQGRKKREAGIKCRISWDHIDKFNANEEVSEKRNYYQIKIDTRKFNKLLSENSNIILEDQLLDLAKGILADDGDRIVGDEKYLFSQIVENNGYANWRNNKFLEEMNNIAKAPLSGFSTILKNRLTNAGSRILLVRGIHGTIVTCQQAIQGESEQNLDCALSLSEISSSFLIQRGEDALIKKFPKFPKTIRIGGAVVGGIFDVIEIVRSTIKLIKCAKAANTDNACSEKEIRDSIAAIVFAGIALVSSIILLAAAAGGPVSILVAVIIIGSNIIYGGISTIIEWKQKYDTTLSENIHLFIRSTLMLSPQESLEELAFKTDSVNSIVKSAWNALNSFPNNTVAYATGLGKAEKAKPRIVSKCPTELKQYEKCELSPVNGGVVIQIARTIHGKPINEVTSDGFKVFKITNKYIVPGNSNINTKNRPLPTEKLSRVLPNEISGAAFICLPKITSSSYENGGESSYKVSSYPNIRYYCDNAVIIEDDSRKSKIEIIRYKLDKTRTLVIPDDSRKSQDRKKYIIFDFKYINSGYIKGLNDLNNIFMISSDGNVEVEGGYGVTNHFMFLNDQFTGKIYFGNYINIIDVSNIKSPVVKFEVDLVQCRMRLRGIQYTSSLIQKDLNDEEIRDTPYINKLKIQYIGRVNKKDNVNCDTVDASIRVSRIGDSIYKDKEILNSDSMHIDSNGGNGEDEFDVIKNCKKLTIGPYTKVEGGSGDYTIFVKSMKNEYANYKNTKSIIDVRGTGDIVFLDIPLLEECFYNLLDNTMTIDIILSQDSMFTLKINNYFNQVKKTPNFNLIDKYGSVVIPKVSFESMSSGQDVGVFIDKFELHLNSKKVKSLTNQDVVTYYKEVSKSRKSFQVFCTAKSARTFFIFGSDSKDIIVLDQANMFIKGGGKSDIYLLLKDDNSKINTIYIDNFDEDKILDILELSSIRDLHIDMNANNDLNIIHIGINTQNGFEIIVLNWKNSNSHKHLILMDQQNNYYIPCECYVHRNIAQFYMASNNQKEFEVRKNGPVVVFTESRNVKFFKVENSLILSIGDKESNELILTVKNFYLDTSKWKDLKIYFYHDGDIDYTYSIDVFAESRKIEDYSYKAIVSEYTITHFNTVKTQPIIQHNHRDEEKVGVLVLENVIPDDILATQEEKNFVLTHTTSKSKVIIEECFFDIRYAIDVIKFSYTNDMLNYNNEPIIIYLVCNFSIENMNSALKIAGELYSWRASRIAPHHEDIVKCLVSLYSLNSENKNSEDKLINYKMLGFVSEADQIVFNNACVTNILTDDNLASYSYLYSNTEVHLKEYKDVLLNRIKLKCYDDIQIQKYEKKILSLNEYDIINTANEYLDLDIKFKYSLTYSGLSEQLKNISQDFGTPDFGMPTVVPLLPDLSNKLNVLSSSINKNESNSLPSKPRSKRSDTSFETIDSYESDIADNESDEYDEEYNDEYNEQQDQLEQVSSSASRAESFISTWIGNSINTVTHYLKESIQLFENSASKLNSDDTMSMSSKGLSYDFVDTDSTNSTDNTNIIVSTADFNSTILLIQYLVQSFSFWRKKCNVSKTCLSEEQRRQVELNKKAKEIIDGLKIFYKRYEDDDYQSENSENVIEEDQFVGEEVNYEHDLYW
ncbi:hypothetical protein [Orientia tsutsugamushi]|uniref:Uncharacterized protein n=1 Tax=Orientia tsutsugamushi (strain Boryong) TaxID=357244 RepID=A5CDQ6_ORITB|nr:hypothetical protein [Orientia tsutsugamushi]CAM80044.1 conserved hypothetical protein [Orientia tsutsugamushi str. Boryong]CAM81200.1 conserved hypothetical protein [Orientia tsutsugamushi str. Boryong]